MLSTTKFILYIDWSQSNCRIHVVIPYRAKLCLAKLLSGETIRHQTKNSSLSPDEKFRPIKVKVSLVGVQMNLRGKKVI